MKHLLEACLVAFALTANVTSLAAAQSTANRELQKGINVELAATSSASPVPDADQKDALIVTVTVAGRLYCGTDPMTASALPNELARGISNRKNKTLYIKVDARTPYSSVVQVLDAARAAGVHALVLLTAQRDSSTPGTPEGLPLSLGPSS